MFLLIRKLFVRLQQRKQLQLLIFWWQQQPPFLFRINYYFALDHANFQFWVFCNFSGYLELPFSAELLSFNILNHRQVFTETEIKKASKQQLRIKLRNKRKKQSQTSWKLLKLPRIITKWKSFQRKRIKLWAWIACRRFYCQRGNYRIPRKK